MSTRVVEWNERMHSLGEAVVAIGVFDGVHVGHQTLLRATVAEARLQGARAVAVTFDRDPDQVVAPQTAAPQLLSLADKLRFIEETGIDTVLVIPFTLDVAAMLPEVFLENVLAVAMRPVALHVGRDFRFGARASGDLQVLERFGMARGFAVTGHELVEVGGEPITSTRIRRLVASGDIAAAAALLGRAPRVAGTVRRGRGEGVALGFPTANLLPEPYAALPADGVYAGRVVFSDGSAWASAVSVGTPPTFPDARDYVEAHLIDFEGDLYDQTLTIEFLERLRPQQAFASLPDLTAAIATDVERALDIAGFESDDDAEVEEYEDDDLDYIADPAALAFAESAARSVDRNAVFDQVDEEWVELLGPTVISGLTGSAGLNGFRITSPLEAAGIPFIWQPYAPEEMPAFRPAYGAIDRPFTLFVPRSYRDSAREALVAEGSVEDDLFEDMSAEVWPTRSEPEDDWFVDDPALLAAAEETVRLQSEDEDGAIDWDSWMPVLIDQPYDRRRLLGLQFALQSVGIPVKWDPFSPARTGLLDRGFFKRPEFTLAVPSERFDEAQNVIAHHASDHDSGHASAPE